MNIKLKCLLCLALAAIVQVTDGRKGIGGKGVLKVRVTRFLNPDNRDKDGGCCVTESKSGTYCDGQCRTFFRVCATHSSRPGVLQQRNSLSYLLDSSGDILASTFSPPPPGTASLRGINYSRNLSTLPTREARSFNPHVPCTLGLLVTDVVANSSLDATREGALDITFPFSTPWPVNFKLIIEAWHDVSGHFFQNRDLLSVEERIGTLIARHVGRHKIEAGSAWVSHRYGLEHTAILYSIRVTCAGPYAGPRCTRNCESLSNEKDSHFLCGADGAVTCLKGWLGEACDVPKCHQNCHPNKGYCRVPGECLCRTGWTGPKCDQCLKAPGCRNGDCNGTPFQCICRAGYRGPFCDQSTCSEGCSLVGGYCDKPGECRCHKGWKGSKCQQCDVKPGCLHGACEGPLECRCKPGWTGSICDTPLCEDCHKEYGTCTGLGECRCKVGWWGKGCRDCFPYPGCQHGSCAQPWDCNCEPGWEGLLCNKRIGGFAFSSTSPKPVIIKSYCTSQADVCLNGGTCIDDVTGIKNFTCVCPPLFSGVRCDYVSATFSFLRPDGNAFTSIRGRDLDSIDTIMNPSALSNAFRQPKIATGRQGQLPFVIIERGMLPLPLFLPKVTDILQGRNLGKLVLSSDQENLISDEDNRIEGQIVLAKPQIKRTGHILDFIEDSLEGENQMEDDSPEKPLPYHEANRNGRVHIGDISGVDKYAPHDEILDAFIELKKLKT